MTGPIENVGSHTPAQQISRTLNSANQNTVAENNQEKLKEVAGDSQKPRPNFLDDLKGYFKKAIYFLKIIFGISTVDNSDFVKLHNKFQTQQFDIKARAQELLSKSQKFIKCVEDNGLENIPLDLGVPMSGKLQSLCSNSDEQRYYHNLAVNWWANAVLGKTSPNKSPGKIYSIDDHDNTWANKNWDPSDTGLVQSLEQIHWGRKIFDIGRKDKLNVDEWINTARAPFPTVIQIIPEGLEKHMTHGLLHGPLQERIGLRLKDQMDALDRCTVIALNSSVIQKPNEPLDISAKVLREDELFEFLEGARGPRINGKTFFQSIRDLVNKYGASVFEPKSIPRYLLESHKVFDGEVHFKMYELITSLKEKHVDNREKGKSEKDAWIEFGRAVKENAQEGLVHWESVDKIKEKCEQGLAAEEIISRTDIQNLFEEELKTKPLKLNDLLSELTSDLKAKIEKANITKAKNKDKNKIPDDSLLLLKTREKAYQHIRLFGSEDKKDSFVSYKEMLDESSQYYNPQGFFDKAVEGIPVSFAVHAYDCHGTPIPEVMDGIVDILRSYADDPVTRRKVAALNIKVSNGDELHRDIKSFIDTGISKFLDEGVKGYLEWRILKHFETLYINKEEVKGQKTQEYLSEIVNPIIGKIFDCSGHDLEFSQKFKEWCTKESWVDYEKITLAEFDCLLQKALVGTAIENKNLSNIIKTFLPDDAQEDLSKAEADREDRLSKIRASRKKEQAKTNIIDDLRKDVIEELKKDPCFSPNEMFLVNSQNQFNGSYLYNSILTLVKKEDSLNPLGQYYWEIQPNREKHQGVPDFNEVLEKNLQIHVAGDSKSDIGMMARALERGGFVDIVFNLVKDSDVYNEIIRHRLAYAKEFRDNDKPPYQLYKDSKKQSEICALEEVKTTVYDEKEKKDVEVTSYRKIESFDENGKPIPEKGELISREKLIDEISKYYQGRITHNTSPEAYIRRRAEIFGLLSGEDIEINNDVLNEEWAVLAKTKGHFIPPEATRLDIYREWRGSDSQGSFIVYRSAKANGALVIDRPNNSEPELYTKGENGLKGLRLVEVVRDVNGKFISREKLADGNLDIAEYKDLEKLRDHVLENKLLQNPTSVKSRFLSKSFISNLPQVFHNLLKYSGALMGAGGIIRLLSKFTGSLADVTYQTGYWLSNGMRAVSALGGVLRGELNVHKFHNIAFGEVINIISSFLPNGVKHLGLGFGNFILFLGRGQQRAQLQQRTNNHTKKELQEKKVISVDPRVYVRKITEIATGLILKVKNEVKEKGISPLIGELAGTLVSAIVTPVQMIKDIFTSQWKLIFQSEHRQSEKSGADYKGVPSAGHLLTLVGALSGIGALIAGTVGRISKIGEVAEGGFNLIGRFFISFANAIPALGIMANAKEVMANTGGLPKLFRDLNGKDDTYDPQKAGLRQYLAGAGFGIVPWFNLENKYVASLFDMVNGLYFLGASEEEKPNTNMLGRSILRKRQEFYNNKQEESIINFSNAA